MQHKIEEIDLQATSYTPNILLNKAAEMLGAKNDWQLAHVLECDPALLCRIRGKSSPLTPWLFMQIMDRTGWHIQYVRGLAGIPFDGREAYAQLAEEAREALARAGIQQEPTPKRPHCIRIEFAGESRTLREWAQHLGVPYTTLWSRKHSGWPPERLFKTRSKPQHTAAQHSTARNRAA